MEDNFELFSLDWREFVNRVFQRGGAPGLRSEQELTPDMSWGILIALGYMLWVLGQRVKRLEKEEQEMEEMLHLTREEAKEVLEMMDCLEGEFASCSPAKGSCRGSYGVVSLECQICEKIREFLNVGEKEE